MTAFTQKRPFIRNINKWGDNKFAALQQMMQKGVPATIVEMEANGTIATVQFEIDSDFKLPKVKMPIYGPQFVRWPLKKGDKGMVLSSDLALGGMSDLGEGVATLTKQFNLATGVFFPIGNAKFDDTDDPDATVMYGPNGVILRDSEKKSVLTLDPEQIKYELGDFAQLHIDKDEIKLKFKGSGDAEIRMSAEGITLSAFGNSIKLDSSGLHEKAKAIDLTSDSTMSITSSGHFALNAASAGFVTSSTFAVSAGNNITLDSSTLSRITAPNSTVQTTTNAVSASVGGYGSMQITTAGSYLQSPWSSLTLDSTQALMRYGSYGYFQAHSNGQTNVINYNSGTFATSGGACALYVDGGTIQMQGDNSFVAGRHFLGHTHWAVQSGGSNTQGVN